MIPSSTTGSYNMSIIGQNIQARDSLHSIPSQLINVSAANQNASSQNQLSPINVVTKKQSIDGSSTSNNLRDTQPQKVSRADDSEASAEVEQVISQPKARDAEVRAHEMAHLGAAAGYSTGMSFTYQKGPDGRQYAIGGEVGIDTSKVANNPEATLLKAQIIQRAALAPAEPSGQDRKVAASALKMMADARTQITESQQAEMVTTGSLSSSENPEGVDDAQKGSIIQGRDASQSGMNIERGLFETRIGLQQEVIAG